MRHESHKDVTLFLTVLPWRRAGFCTHWYMQTLCDERKKEEKLACYLFPNLCTRSLLQKLQKPWDDVWKGQEWVQSVVTTVFRHQTVRFNTAVIYLAQLIESSREMRRPLAEMSQLVESRQDCLQGNNGRCVSGSTAWSHEHGVRIQAKSVCLFSPNPKPRQANNQADTQKPLERLKNRILARRLLGNTRGEPT